MHVPTHTGHFRAAANTKTNKTKKKKKTAIKAKKENAALHPALAPAPRSFSSPAVSPFLIASRACSSRLPLRSYERALEGDDM
jgi:hypothetical protein